MIAKFWPVHGRPGPFRRITPPVRVLLTLAALAIALCFNASEALAKGKTVALVVEGPDAEVVRSAIAAAVPHGTPIADASAFKSSLFEQGVKTPFGRALDGAARDKTLAHIRKAAAAAGVEGTLIAQVTRTHRERHVRLLLVATSGAAGDLEDEVVLGAKPSKDDDEKLASSVGTALVDYRGSSGEAEKTPAATKPAPATEEETPTPETEHAAAPAEGQPAADTGPKWQRPHGVFGHDLIALEVGFGALGRHFGYTVGPTSATGSVGNLPYYKVFPAAAVSVGAEFYPLADSDSAILRDIGLIGFYSRSLFLQSTLNGGTVDTTASSFTGGLRWRTMPGGEGGIQLGISLTYALQSFGFGQPAGPAPTDLPSVSYQAIRPGVDVRVPVGKLAIVAQAGFRACLSAGDATDVAMRFRGTTTTGFDVGGGIAFEFAPGWEVRALADYEGYFYSFSPQYDETTMSGDAFRAQGAIDHNYSGRIAIAVAF
jgi:hypothetical protein